MQGRLVEKALTETLSDRLKRRPGNELAIHWLGQAGFVIDMAGARLVISGRRMTLALSSAAAPFWAVLWPRLMALQWADP